LRLAKEAVGDYLVEAKASWKAVSDNNRTANPLLEPTVALTVDEGALEFSISYVVNYTKRTVMKDRLFSAIVNEIARPGATASCKGAHRQPRSSLTSRHRRIAPTHGARWPPREISSL
jgi:hypothetical protein